MPGMSFIDDFDRPDTSLGLGDGWDIRGQYVDGYPLPAASDGFVSDGRFAYAGNATVIAARRFPAPVFRVGGIGRWTELRPGVETTVAMGITSNDNILSDMVQFAATRNGWNLLVRRNNGRFHYVANETFSPPLELNHDYTFEFTIANPGQVIVRVPGHTQTVKVGTLGLQGDRGYWSMYVDQNNFPAGTVFGFDSVWAAESGAPLASIPSGQHN